MYSLYTNSTLLDPSNLRLAGILMVFVGMAIGILLFLFEMAMDILSEKRAPADETEHYEKSRNIFLIFMYVPYIIVALGSASVVESVIITKIKYRYLTIADIHLLVAFTITLAVSLIATIGLSVFKSKILDTSHNLDPSS